MPRNSGSAVRVGYEEDLYKLVKCRYPSFFRCFHMPRRGATQSGPSALSLAWSTTGRRDGNCSPKTVPVRRR